MLLIKKLMEGFLQYGDSEKAKITPSHIKDGYALYSHLGILQPTSSSKPYMLLIKKLMEGFRQYGDSEKAKITTFSHQRWLCTIQPSWNSSTNIFFKTINSLDQKLYESLSTIWRLRNSLYHPIHTSKMTVH